MGGTIWAQTLVAMTTVVNLGNLLAVTMAVIENMVVEIETEGGETTEVEALVAIVGSLVVTVETERVVPVRTMGVEGQVGAREEAVVLLGQATGGEGEPEPHQKLQATSRTMFSFCFSARTSV